MITLADTRAFGAEVIDELRKVTWPDWPQLKNSTAVILVFVVIVAGIIALMDFTVSRTLNLIINLFAG